MQMLRKEKVCLRQELSGEEKVEDILLAFFEQVHDATGYARPSNLFGFPPNKPSA